MSFHPCPDHHGQAVPIRQPHAPTLLSTWQDPTALATTVPLGPCPAVLNGIAVTPWTKAPTDVAGWRASDGSWLADEPPFPSHPHPTAGAVVLESDGRVWVVSPTNAFGGYTNTFPKGHPDPGLSLAATAVKETFEETGLHIRILAHLIDVVRTTSIARYYLAKRLGGSPAAMGWESQAVHLVPTSALAEFVTHPKDQPILQALAAHLNQR